MSNDSTGQTSSWFGGRKQLNAWMFATLLTAMAVKLDAEFDAYALWLAVGILGTATANVIQKRGP